MVFSFLKKNKTAALVTVMPDQGAWCDLGQGAHYRQLHCDVGSESGNLRLLPGGQVTLRTVPAETEILLIEGALTLAEETYRAGDFCVLPAVQGTWVFESTQGALCFLRRDALALSPCSTLNSFEDSLSAV